MSFDGEGQGVGTGVGSTANFGIGTLNPEDQLELTRNLLLAHTVSDATGVINKKGNTRFIHDFGTDNDFFGVGAGNFTLTGSGLVGVGHDALSANTTGSNNTAVGLSSMMANTTGTNNNAFGVATMYSNTTGNQNNAYGYQALYSNTIGGDNNAVGLNSMYANTTGGGNNALGSNTLRFNTTGNNNEAIGYNALFQNTSGSFNNAVGLQTLFNNTTGNFNSGMGFNALFSNTTGGTNVAIGASALQANTTASSNTAVGVNAGQGNTTGTGNSFFGQGSGTGNTTGTNNTILGQNAATQNQTGSNNTLVGQSAGNGSGGNSYSRLTAVGSAAFINNTTGGFNAGLGVQAGLSNTTGSENTAIGDASLAGNSTGSQNVALGRGAGNANTTGSRNTYLGYFAGISSTNNLTNSGAIGYNAQVTENNAIMIGGTGANIVEVGIGLTAADTRLDVNGKETVRDLSAVVGQVLCHNGSRNNFLGPGIPGGVMGECSVQPPRIANNGLRINTETDPTAPRVQIGAAHDATPARKTESNLIFNTEVPQNNFSIAWTGQQANSLFGIGTLAGSVPDPARTLAMTTSNLNERLDVVGNIENIADPSLNPTPIVDTATAACVNGALTGINPNYIKVIGRYAYVLNSFSATIQIFDVFRPTCPQLVSTISVPAFLPPSTGLSYMMDVQGGFAYVVQAGDLSNAPPTPTPALTNQGRLFVVDVSNPQSLQAISNSSTIWSNTKLRISDPRYVRVYGDYAYIVGKNISTNQPQFEVVDISHPGRPTSVSIKNLDVTGGWVGGLLPFAATSISNNFGLFVHDHFAYIVSEGVLQVMDVTNPDNPIPRSGVITGTATFRVFVQGRYVYTLARDGQIRIYSVGTGTGAPTLVSSLSTGILAQFGGDILASGRYLFAVTNPYASASMNMWDIANPALPVSVGVTTTNNVAGGGPNAMYLNGRYMYIVNGSNSSGAQNNLRVLDIHGIETTSILAHSAEVGSLGVQTSVNVHDNVSVGQGLSVGNGIINYGDETVYGNIENLANRKFNPNTRSADSILSDPNIAALGLFGSTTPSSTYVQGRYAYVVSTGNNYLHIIDFTNVDNPQIIGGIALILPPLSSTSPSNIYVQGKYAYITASGSDTMLILDISNPRTPTYISRLAFPVGSQPRQVIVSDRYAYIRNNNNTVSNSIMVVDIANPANPRLMSTITLGANDDVSSIFLQGQFLYATMRGNVATGNKLQIYDVSTPWSPLARGSFNQTSSGAGTSPRYYLPSSVYVQGRYAYVVFLNPNGTIIDTTGASSVLTTGRDNGLSLVAIDITNPDTPVLGGNYSIERPFTTSNGALVGPPNVPYFRDGKVFVQGRYAYLSLDNSMIRVIDVIQPSISNPNPADADFAGANPQKMVLVGATSFEGVGTGRESGIGGAGNIGAQTATSLADFMVVGRYLFRTPQSAVSPFNQTNQLEIMDVHGIETTSLIAHSAEVGGLEVQDNASFNASVSVSDGISIGNGLSVSGDSSFVGQMNVTGDKPTLIGSVAVNPNPFSITVRGKYGYVTNSSGTIQVVDLSNPQSPSIVSSLGSQGIYNLSVQGKYAYAANGTTTNFQIFDISNSSTPVSTSTLNIGVGATWVHAAGRYAYIGTTAGTLLIVDISNPFSPYQVSSLALGAGSTWGDFAEGRYIYLAHQGSSQMRIVDVINPLTPVLVGSVAVATPATGIKVRGGYAYMTQSGGTNMYIVDVRNPTAPTLVSTFTSTTGAITSVDIMGKYAYTGGTGGVQVIDISNAASPTFVYRTNVTGAGLVWSVSAVGRYLYTVDNTTATLRVFDLGGAYIQQLEAGGIEASALNLRGSFSATDGNLIGGLSLGTGLHVQGDAGVQGKINIGGSTAININNFRGQHRTSILDSFNATDNRQAVAAITNLDTTDNALTNVLRLNVGTATTGTATRFMRFFAGSTHDFNGTAVGSISLNNNAVSYNTAGADFAEHMFMAEGVTTEPGDIIATTPDGNNRGLVGEQLIGVVSDTAGFVGNFQEETQESVTNSADASGSAKPKRGNIATVGLLGQISTKISTLNGNIKKGDPIGASDMRGVGAKQIEKGSIVGYALEDFNCLTNGAKAIESSGVCIGKIKVLVDPSVYNPNEVFELDGLNFEEGTIYDDLDLLKTIQTKAIRPQTLLSKKESTTSAVFKVEAALSKSGLSDSQALNLAIAGIKNLDARLAKLENGVQIDSDGNIVFSGNVKVKSIDADKVTAFEYLTQKVSSMEAKLNATNSANFDTDTSNSDRLTQNDGLTSSNLKALNMLESEGGLKVGGESVFNGKTVFNALVEFIQNVIFKGNVEFAGRTTFNKDTAGSVVIKKDTAGIEVRFAQEYEGAPSINATISTDNETIESQVLNGELRFIITKRTGKGFTIKLNKTAPEDVEFSWTAFIGKGEVVGTTTSIETTKTDSLVVSSTPSLSDEREIVAPPSASIATESPTPTIEAQPTSEPTPLVTMLEPTEALETEAIPSLAQ